VGESVPPPFPNPLHSPLETDIDILVFFAQKKWPIEMKDVEKRVIVKDVDRCSM
jgi:hypothetical protein